MSSAAFLGAGTVVSYCATEDGVYTPLAEVTNVDGPTKSRDTVEVTNLDSEGGYMEFIGGFRNPGQVNIPMNFTHDTYEIMNTLFEADDRYWFRIDLPNTEQTRFQFEGLVINCPISVQTKSQVLSNVSIQCSGQIDFSALNT